ncbi:beta-ketoacyl synthase N-terminal-like domain-containing protein [Micromonospora sp. WMMA1363]|uniref:type I polyketide synthase n=1 Tax=Micromonospora sp. WMMA1363 TaxID=3053985 RepID=UPI00259D1DAB|nr:type I polyketide synthase [Micromonospora sp. WMMA1363]MDM4721113.1 beta-ketoacyl synthase N-terminal-like domain-containing protein [Micromonospora sp. WMMA1363]
MTGHQIAIVGMAALMPSAGDLESFRRNLVDGVDAITDVPPHRVDPLFYDPQQAHRPDRLYCRRGGFVDEPTTFDPLKFGIMPVQVVHAEPDQLIALQVAAAAIDDAGGPDRLPERDRVGVIIGRGGYLGPAEVRFVTRIRILNQVITTVCELVPDVTPAALEQIRQCFDERLGAHSAEGAVGFLPNLAASRIANRLDLHGPAYTVDAACASSLIAIDQAAAELVSGRLDAVLAGGVHHVHDVVLWSVMGQVGAMSRRGQIRPFDTAADGMLLGEGTGVVVLKRLADAERDGDRVYAVIRGSGVASDGRAASPFRTDAGGQVLAIRRAWAAAGLDPTAPDALGMLEAHGTATPAGDATELTAIAEVFGPHPGGPPPVLGSVKSMIGHLMPAAGIAGLIKAALAVHHGVQLPTLHCETPRPELQHSRFAPIGSAQPWESTGPRRAAVNAFGFGGINAHVILEEAPDSLAARKVNGGTTASLGASRTDNQGSGTATAVVAVDEPEQVVRLAAPDPDTLLRWLDADDHAVRARGIGPGPANAVPGGACRLGIVDPDPGRLAVARKVVAKGQPWRGGRDIWFTPTPLLADPDRGKTAFVFPGPEAEFTPRTTDLAAHFGLPDQDWSVAEFIRHADGIVELGLFLAKALDRVGITPDAVAGYSMGEWTAEVVGGRYDESVINDVHAAVGALTSQPSRHAFAAVGVGVHHVTPLLAEHPTVVLTHDNSPVQCVVNGPEPDLDNLIKALRDAGILCRKLPFRAQFHTPAFASVLESTTIMALSRMQAHPARIPIWSANLKAPLPADDTQMHETNIRHMREPVWFRETVAVMYDAGIRVFLQAGTGQLASVISDNLRGRDHLAMPVNVPHRSGLSQLRRVATALWVEGGTPNLDALGVPGSTGAAGPCPPRLTASPAATVPGARTAAAAPTPPTQAMTLDLGGPLIRLGDRARGLLQVPAQAGDTVRTQHGDVRTGPQALTALHGFAARSRAAAELAALLHDTADSAVTVLTAAEQGVPATGSGQSTAAPEQSAAPAGRPSAGAYHTLLRISLETMPYLRDHSFFVQPDDWPDPADRWPLVPAATMVQHMIDATRQAVPGAQVVGVRDARFRRWCLAAPPQDVEITIKAAGPGRFTASFGRYARATIEVAAGYPAESPAVWRHDPAAEQPLTYSAVQKYAERWLFHGPAFQGITAIHALGQRHIRGLLTTPAAPGALLDNALQCTTHWMLSTQDTRTSILPMALEGARFFGPAPKAGTTVESVTRVRSIGPTEIVADIQLHAGDQVWAQLEGVAYRRLDGLRRLPERLPARFPLSERRPEGWTTFFDRYADPISRNLLAYSILGASSSAVYDRQPLKDRIQWLAGRIAAVDAVRIQLWDRGHAEVYPIELTVTDDPSGRPRMHSRPGRAFGEWDISFASTREIGVAIAKPQLPHTPVDAAGVGIDVVEVDAHANSAAELALSDQELKLIDGMGTDGDGRRGWLARFRTAENAVAKAEGIFADSRRFTVVAATPTTLTVQAGTRIYEVGCREVENPDDLPPRRYVVCWTWGPQPASPLPN